MRTIVTIEALEILDSRGTPSLSVAVTLSDHTRASARVPSGASTGTYEAVELRDGDTTRYAGKGVLRAVQNVERELGPALRGMDAENQRAIDQRMIDLDGSPNKSRLGANAILGVSCAVARAVARSRRMPLWRLLAEMWDLTPRLPVPMVNILSGGAHAERRIEFQDFLVIPRGFATLRDSLEAMVRIHRSARDLLRERHIDVTGVADEGGWGPAFANNRAAVDLLSSAIVRAGFSPGREFDIAIDVAASHFRHGEVYRLASEGRALTRDEMIDLLDEWTQQYPVAAIEDGLEENDWEGWAMLTRRLGSRVQLVGDDLFATNPARLQRGIDEGAANAVLVKMNQIGTLTETFETLRTASSAGYRTIVSARSGETEDSFLADLAVASGAGQVKIGSLTRSERLAKYNRLLEIEARELGPWGTITAPRHDRT